MALNKTDEVAVNFYETNLMVHADLIYRISYALCLSLDDAKKLTVEAFSDVADNLEALIASGKTEFKKHMLKLAWKKFSEGSMSGKQGKTAISQALSPIESTARAALVFVDLAGLSAVHAAELLEVDEKTFRLKLASARRDLMMSPMQY